MAIGGAALPASRRELLTACRHCLHAHRSVLAGPCRGCARGRRGSGRARTRTRCRSRSRAAGRARGQLGEVGVLVGREPRSGTFAPGRRFASGVERQARFLQREAVDVAVQDGERVRRQRDREAGLAEAPDDSVVVPQCCGAGSCCATPSGRSPAVARQCLAGGDRPAAWPSSSRLRRGAGRSRRRRGRSCRRGDRPCWPTCLYSDIASTPRASPSLRMVSDAMPCSSAKVAAARSTRSRLSGGPGCVAGMAGRAISARSPVRVLTKLTL